MTTQQHKYPLGEEIANSVTHGVGAIFSVVALTLMVVFASFGADPWRIVSVSIFGASLIVLYLASTLYHAFPWPRVKKIMRVFDHSAIYFLIAGTYTPYLLVNMRGPWGWSLFVVLWTATVAGCFFKAFCMGRWNYISTLIYVAMGWSMLVALKPALQTIPTGALVLMLIGGIFYTFGVVFYLWERLPYNHAIWHLFVLGGSVTHFVAVFCFVALATT